MKTFLSILFFSLISTSAHAFHLHCIRSDISHIDVKKQDNGKYLLQDLSIDMLKEPVEIEAAIDYGMLIQFTTIESDGVENTHLFRNLNECLMKGTSKSALMLLTRIKDGQKYRPNDQLFCECSN